MILIMLLSTLLRRAFHSPVIVRLANVYLDGQNIYSHYGISHYFGTVYGSIASARDLVQLPIVCDVPALLITTRRRVKKYKEVIVREHIASAMIEGDDRNFLAEIKRIRGNKAGTSKIVDGLSDVNSIAQLFAEKYRNLYSSVSYNKSEMRSLINGINRSLTGLSVSSTCF
jgi:hypothetical protein